FHRYVHHLALHSFPTRRSSDLGAGFAGLAAARRLTENRPHDHIVILDAQKAGDGASGRNAGFAIDLPHNVSSSLEQLEKSNSYRSEEHTSELQSRENIVCRLLL